MLGPIDWKAEAAEMAQHLFNARRALEAGDLMAACRVLDWTATAYVARGPEPRDANAEHVDLATHLAAAAKIAHDFAYRGRTESALAYIRAGLEGEPEPAIG